MSGSGDREKGSRRIYAGFCRPFAEDEFGLLRRFVIADAYARFLRARGQAGELSFGIECFGEPIKLEAVRRGLTPRAAVDEYVGQLQCRFQSLGIYCDWDQVVLSSEQDHCLRTQQMFLRLLEEGLVYEREDGADRSRWAARTSHFAERCDLEAAPVGWSSEAVEVQRMALGRVDGVEIRTVLLGAGDLVVFTPHGDSIEQAAFVAVSPNHPQIEAFATATELAQLRDARREPVFVQTSLQVAVPAVDELLPLVLTPSVDARFGPTAVLGLPDRDEVDRAIAARLKSLPSLSLGAVRVRSDPKPATRYRLSDLSISREGGWGIPVPIVHCRRCGAVPVSSAELPVEPPEPGENPEGQCPRCNGSARRDEGSIDPSFDSMWMWPSICSGGDGGWTEECQVIWSSEEGDRLLQQRLAAHILTSLDRSESCGGGEPFADVLMHGSLHGEEVEAAIESASDLAECIAGAGGDAVRLAILNAGSPGRSTHLYAHLLRHADRFIERVREQIGTYEDRFASGQVDPSTRSRRRLAAWSKIATDKVSTHLESLEMHKAAYDVMHFQSRIEAFEGGCLENDGLTDADRDAIAWSLVHLGRISEPLTPRLAAELKGLAVAAAS